MSRTILIADDDAAVLKMLQEELESRGYLVLTTLNGLNAVRQAQKHQPDLIVLDVAMPMTNGLQAFEKLRTLPETKTTPVIFLTSVPSAEVYPTVAKGLHVAHLKKPVDIADLLSLIQQFLK